MASVPASRNGPDYVYLNAYGKKADTPFGGTDGRMYRLIGADGTDEVFLCAGTTFSLPYAAVSVTALDEAGKEIGPAPFTVENGQTRLTSVKKALSYRVAKPPSWREATYQTENMVYYAHEKNSERFVRRSF